MIRARCLHRSGHRFTNSSVDLGSSSRPSRKFYSAFAGTTLRGELARNPPQRTSGPWQLRQWPLQRLKGDTALRFASTTPIPPPIAEVQFDYVPPPPAEGELLPNPLDEVTTSISPPVYDHLGFLKEMGLDYGWGPTAFVENLLEHVHIYLGTPWWASLGVSILIIRAGLFKFYMDAADSSARRQVIKPLEAPIMTRYHAAKANGDSMGLRQAWIERRVLYKNAGIRWWSSLVLFVQLPLGFGTFRLMRGMSTLPVPGLDTGGLLWISDLTVPDPYIILPVAAAWAYYYAFKKGGETGNSDLLSKKTQQVFLYVFPILGGGFMAWWPAGLQLTLCIGAFVSMAQAVLISKGWFRNLVGIQPLPERAAPTPQSQNYPQYQAPGSNRSTLKSPAGIFGNMKDTVSDIMKLGEKYSPMSKPQAQKGRLTGAEKRHAKAYEEKRRKELAEEAAVRRQSAQARFEREQEKVARDQERREGLQRRADKKAKRKQ